MLPNCLRPQFGHSYDPNSVGNREAEKVFDEVKNKLGEKKAWGTSQETRESQAQFIAIVHNLMMLYDSRLEEDHGVKNEVEDRRRARRVVEAEAACKASGKALSTLVTAARRTTQRSVKFVRWVRSMSAGSDDGSHRRAPPQGPLRNLVKGIGTHRCPAPAA